MIHHRPMIRIRRARKDDSAAIGRVHVETWQATYAGLLPDAMLAGMSDVRQSAYWSRLLADPREARGVFVGVGTINRGSRGLSAPATGVVPMSAASTAMAMAARRAEALT